MTKRHTGINGGQHGRPVREVIEDEGYAETLVRALDAGAAGRCAA